VTTIEFRGLSLQEAEEVLVDVWNCLEEYAIPSPAMTFAFAGGADVSFRMRFAEPLWARLVANRLSSGMIARHAGAVQEGKTSEAVGRYLLVSGARKSPSRAYRLS
jgi:hypothetical protein